MLQTERPANPELAPARASASAGGGYSARGSSAYDAMGGMGAMGMGMGGMGEQQAFSIAASMSLDRVLMQFARFVQV